MTQPQSASSETAGPATWTLGLGVFAVLFCGAALLPSQARWTFTWAPWPNTMVPLLALPFVLVAVLHWRLRFLQHLPWTLPLAIAGLAAGLWAAPRTPMMPMVSTTFIHLLLLVVCGFLCARVVSSDRSLWSALALLIASVAGLVALGGLIEVAIGINPLYEGSTQNHHYTMYRGEKRAMSTLFNPAPLGSFLVMAWPFAAWLTRSRDRPMRIVGLVSLPLILTTTFLTASRGALLGLVVSVAVALMLARRPRALVLLASLFGLLMFVASHLPYPWSKYGSHSLLGSGGVSAVQRLARVEATVAILAERPLLGIGLHEFKRRFDAYYPAHRASWGKGNGIVDNTYLTVLAETGLLGAAALASFLLIEIGRGARAWRRRREGFVGAALVSLTGLLVTAAGYDLNNWTAPTLCLALVLGLLSGSAIEERRGGAPS